MARILLVGPGDAGYVGAPRENEAADGIADAWFCAPNDRYRSGDEAVYRWGGLHAG